MPDLNVWLALSWINHLHTEVAWEWYSRQKASRFLFCRITQMGLLRLLATDSVMGGDVQTINHAWRIYDRWLQDPSIDIWQELLHFDAAFRSATRPLESMRSPKALGDCYLLAVSQVADATLDHALASACKKAGQPVALIA